MHATAGSLIGIGEIVLLPLDVLKIKRQTNPEAFRGRGVFRIVADEGMGLYRGAGWTAARNAPGSFAVRPVVISECRELCLLTQIPAIWRFRSRKGVSLQTHRLQHRKLPSEFRCLHRWCFCITHRLRTLGCYQDENPESEFRKSRVRI